LEKIKNKNIKEIMGVKGKPDIIDIIEKKRLQWYGHVKRMPEERIPKVILELVLAERRKRGRPRKNMDGRSTRSHDSEKFRTKSMEKQGGMAFAFRKTATAVIEPDR
jgi:Tfp pilus assembly pilus retraction ATPase PilT